MIASKPPKTKKCRECKEQFMPMRPMQRVCGPMCALKVARATREKLDRQETKKRKEAAKPRSQWVREAQAAVNAWVRLRDAHLPCISCGRHHEGQWHAGHYRSTGAAPHLRFDPRNIHKQCAPCNTHLSGNLIAYRAGLIARAGLATVEALEQDHALRHYSVDELKAIKAEFTAKRKELQA